jgi:hypothetical protein
VHGRRARRSLVLWDPPLAFPPYRVYRSSSTSFLCLFNLRLSLRIKDANREVRILREALVKSWQSIVRLCGVLFPHAYKRSRLWEENMSIAANRPLGATTCQPTTKNARLNLTKVYSFSALGAITHENTFLGWLLAISAEKIDSFPLQLHGSLTTALHIESG